MKTPSDNLETGNGPRGSAHSGSMDTDNDDTPLEPGSKIGPYRVDSLLGVGTSSFIYLANRASPDIQQLVALKLVRPNPGLADRFRRERQTLAGLRHEGIARLIDGGATEDRRLWFALEPVIGSPIDAFARQRRLSWQERLKLFVAVCDAIAYAHSRLVVHRDIKPANIIVDEHGRPKLLDFGIAVVDASEAGGSEQLPVPDDPTSEQGTDAGSTTASDIRQLGLLLELLILPDRSPCTTLPSAPARTTQEDLLAIIDCATAANAADRYSAVSLLRADVDAVLSSHPVAARRGGAAYRIAKFFSRHALPAFVAGIGILVLTAALAVHVRRLAQERDLARAAADHAESVSAFLVGMFQVADPGENRSERITAAELLERGSTSVQAGLGEGEAYALSFALEIGRVYIELGGVRRAQAFLQQVLDASPDKLTPSLAHARVLSELGWAHFRLNEYQVSRMRLSEALAELESLAPSRERELEVAKVSMRLGGVEATTLNMPAARVAYQRAFDINGRLLAPGDRQFANVANSIGVLEMHFAEYAQARGHLLQAQAGFREAFGEVHPRMAMVGVTIGLAEIELGDYQSAESRLHTSIATSRSLKVLLYEAFATETLAKLRLAQGRLRESIELYNRALDLRLELGVTQEQVGVRAGLGEALRHAGEVEKSIEVLRKGVEIANSVGADAVADTAAMVRLELGRSLALAGQLDEAEALIREANAELHKVLPQGHPNAIRGSIALAALHRRLGREAEVDMALRGIDQELGAVVTPNALERLRAELKAELEAAEAAGPDSG